MSLLRYTRVYICDIDPPCRDALHTVPQGIMTCIAKPNPDITRTKCGYYTSSTLPLYLLSSRRVQDGTIHRDRQDLIVMPGPQELDSNGEHSSEEDGQEQWCGILQMDG